MASSSPSSPPAYALEESLDVVFHGVSFNLSLSVFSEGSSEELLAVDLEELATGAMWHGEFSASFLENITSKTGSFKRFDVLVKMLQGALLRQSDVVFMDLLTFADLVRGQPFPMAQEMALLSGLLLGVASQPAPLLSLSPFLPSSPTFLPPGGPEDSQAGCSASCSGLSQARHSSAPQQQALPDPDLCGGV
jgi:hypothetical protein